PSHPSSLLFPYTSLFRSTSQPFSCLTLSSHRRFLAGEFYLSSQSGGCFPISCTQPVIKAHSNHGLCRHFPFQAWLTGLNGESEEDRKSTRLNSSHVSISY